MALFPNKIRTSTSVSSYPFFVNILTDLKVLSLVDPRKRLTARMAMQNEWITGDDAKLAKNDLGANLYKLRNFNAKRKLRAAVSAIIAMNRLNTLTSAFAAN